LGTATFSGAEAFGFVFGALALEEGAFGFAFGGALVIVGDAFGFFGFTRRFVDEDAFVSASL
jgi:hypothetical protein